MKNVLRVAAAAAIAVLFAASTAGAQTIQVTPELAKIIEAAKKEKALTLESGPNIFGAGLEDRMTAEMKKMFGLPELTIRFSPGGPMGVVGNKIATEFRAGQTSSTDAWTGAAPQVVPYLKLNMFHKVEWDKLLPSRIKPEYIEADGTALRAATGVPGILYNIKKAPEFTQVKVLDDLLTPAFKNKFATTPFAGGFDVLLAKDVWGVEKTEAYIEKLAGQVQGLLPCGGTDRIASGEFLALALDCTGASYMDPQYQGIVGLQVVSDNAQRRPYYLMIPKHAAHPNMAILYSVYMSTPEGQEVSRLSWRITLYEYPETHRHQEIADLEAKGIVFRDITVDWWLAHPGIDEANNKLARILRSASK